jgi:AcrR family transcriptional regulator
MVTTGARTAPRSAKEPTAARPATEPKPDRRRVRTRAALIAAAQRILAEDARGEVSIKEITDAADVGFGSFYNHFDTKAQLFEAAIEDMLERQGALIDAVTADLTDPAEVYIVGFRLTGRLSRAYPRLARLLVNTGLAYVTADVGLASRALSDLRTAVAAGRLSVEDPEAAQAAVGGALLGLLQYLDSRPDVDAALATDALAVSLLRMLGMTRRQAEGVVARPLPDVPASGDV